MTDSVLTQTPVPVAAPLPTPGTALVPVASAAEAAVKARITQVEVAVSKVATKAESAFYKYWPLGAGLLIAATRFI